MLDAVTGVLVAVSGGPDSVALLDMLLRLAPGVRGWGLGVRGEQRGGGAEELGSTEAPLPLCPSAPPRFSSPQPPNAIPHLHIAHLDHMLRGRESAEDAEFVRALADRLGLQITINSADVRAAAEAAGRGVEETAREIRYDFLLRVASETGCDRIAVGHTMTDQAETFVMRLIRGAGSRGLAAMRAVSPAHIFSSQGAEVRRSGGAEGQRCGGAEVQRRGGADGQRGGGAPLPLGSSTPQLLCPSAPLLIRPLLCITREEVEAYCRERQLEFRTDVTNQDPHYTRNRIRSSVIPAMTAINPRVVESIARAAENLASDQDALDSISKALLDNARIESPNSPDHDEDSAAYSATALLEQPPGMRRRMIIEALRLARGTTGVDFAGGEVSSTHVRAVEALLSPAASGKRITLPGGLEVWREFESLVLRRSGVGPGAYQIAISASDTEVQAGGFGFTLERDQPGALLKSVIATTQREKARLGLNWMSVVLSDSALPDCLIIRPRQSGERAHVVGQPKTKKLKNLMIDHRIPSSRRANWPLVTTPDGRYVWSPGLPPALEFAARDETQRLAILRASAI
jgi:tRNA(Ile)-lysidine synthase